MHQADTGRSNFLSKIIEPIKFSIFSQGPIGSPYGDHIPREAMKKFESSMVQIGVQEKVVWQIQSSGT